MSDSPAEDFPHPLDTDLVEQVPVRRYAIDSIDEKTGRAQFSVKTIMQQRVVRYMNAPKIKARCAPGSHIFRMLNAKKSIFGCTLCPFAVRIHPANYIFKDGKLTHRRTLRTV